MTDDIEFPLEPEYQFDPSTPFEQEEPVVVFNGQPYRLAELAERLLC